MSREHLSEPERQRGNRLASLAGARALTSRRCFLTSAASGLGVAALASLLEADGLLASQPHFKPRAKNCIFVFLIGGTSQIELFDPKPALQKLDGQPIPESFKEGVRLGQTKWTAPLWASRFGYRRYGRCGMEMSEMLPHIGAHADDICLIRSMHHEAFDHAPGELMFCTGKVQPGRPSMGSWLSYGLGSETKNLPGYVVMVNGRSPKAREMIWGNGILPSTHQGVLFRTSGSPILNLETPSDISAEMHRAQMEAIAKLDRLNLQRTRDPQTEARIAAYELAFRMQSAAPELTDLSKESKQTMALYGDGDFARSLLLARRLVERGVRFVTVTHNVWDHHDNLAAELPTACKQVDRPIGALLGDLKQRGLLDETLVVCGSEFGRTAITQGDPKKPGRDHHPHAFSVFLAGGGVKGGQVIGKTDELAWRVVEDPVHQHDFHATMLHLFGLDHKRLAVKHQGLDVRLSDVAGTVVEKVFG